MNAFRARAALGRHEKKSGEIHLEIREFLAAPRCTRGMGIAFASSAFGKRQSSNLKE
ncbi:MAG: hypothetical protein K2R98_14185 [Gemmataceae bacterium]|nr:hypothetical protein [Gemmataceae bacterium]